MSHMEKRGTGKTTAMLKRALSDALSGANVFVLGSSTAHCKEMMRMLQALADVPHFAIFHYTNTEVALWPKGQIRFKTVWDQDWDPRMERVMGFPAGLPIYVDHSTDPKAKLRPKENPASNSTKESPSTSKMSDSSSGGHSKH